MSFIVFVVLFPYLHPFVTFILSFWTPQSWLPLTLITHLCYFCSCAFKIQLFSSSDFFFFSREHFLKGLCWCSFQLFFCLSLLTWIGSVGLVSALCQEPDYPSQCVTSMDPVQAAPPYEFSWPVAAPWCSLYNSLCGQTVRVNCVWQIVNQYKKQKGWGKRW